MYAFEVRINGVVKLANQIVDVPAFHFDGKTVTIVAELTEEPPVPDVPRMDPNEIQSALDAEGESPEGADQGAEETETEQGADGQSSQLDDKPRRGGRRKRDTQEDPNTGHADQANAEQPSEEA